MDDGLIILSALLGGLIFFIFSKSAAILDLTYEQIQILRGNKKYDSIVTGGRATYFIEAKEPVLDICRCRRKKPDFHEKHCLRCGKML